MDMIRIRARLLVDGTGAPPMRDGALLVQGDRILEVGPDASVPTPEAATLLDFPDATLLPGLVDSHTHLNLPGDGTGIEDAAAEGEDLLLLRSAQNARLALESGVTTLRDTGAAHHTTFSLKRAIRQGIVPGPRLSICGRPLTVTGGHCWPFGGEADGPEGVRQASRQLIKEGADFIKVMTTGGGTLNTIPHRASYTLEELRPAVEEAHASGRMAVGHALGTDGIVNALDAGFDTIIHCYFYERDGRHVYRPEIARRIADQGVWVNPTLHVQHSRIWRLEKITAERPVTEAEAAELQKHRRNFEGRCQSFQALLAAGVRAVAGSDSGWAHYPFGGFGCEIEAMAAAGMAPADALRAATLDAARCLGVDGEVGSLERSKLADLLLVEGDPSADVGSLRRVVAAFLGGKRIR